MEYIVQISLLSIFQISYYFFANLFKIYDNPNSRSSHSKSTIVGGGIVFPFSIFVWMLFSQTVHYYFLIGLILIAVLSLIDDLFNVHQLIRILIHFLSSYLLIYELSLHELPVFVLVVLFILIIGWFNAFNFMDGINGMMTMYSISIFLTFYILNVNIQFVDSKFIEIVLFALIIFGFFNIRKNALMFSGDVGSISLSYIITFIFIAFTLKNFNINYILFFSIYGIDTVWTIIDRLRNKQNIFKPHRTHLYQYLVNEIGMNHLFISFVYSATQFLINIIVIFILVPNVKNDILSTTISLILLSFFYLIIKRKIVLSIKK